MREMLLVVWATAAPVFSQNPDPKAVALSLNQQALEARSKRTTVEADRLTLEALTAAEKSNDPMLISTCLYNRAMVLQELGRYHEAEPLQRRVVTITQPTTYVRAIYSKWKDGKTNEGERFLKDIADKGASAVMAINPDQTGRLRLKRMFPSGNEIGHDYIFLSFSKTPPNLDNSQAPTGFLKGAGMAETEYLNKQASLRTTVKMEIWTDIYRHGSISEGDFVQVRYMDPPKGKAADYVEMTRQYESAMRAALVQKGVTNSQQLFRLWGTEEQAPYNFVNLVAYKNSADLFKTWGNRT